MVHDNLAILTRITSFDPHSKMLFQNILTKIALNKTYACEKSI